MFNVDWQWLSNYIAGFVGGGSSGLAAVAGLWKYLSDRSLAKQKAQFDGQLAKQKAESDRELETYKVVLDRQRKKIEAEIGHVTYVTQTQFDTEFKAIKESFALLAQVRIQADSIRGFIKRLDPETPDDYRWKVEDERVKAFGQAYDEFIKVSEGYLPFIPSAIQKEFVDCSTLAREEAERWRTSFEGGPSYDEALGRIREEKIRSSYLRAAAEIREHFKKLRIVNPD